MEKYRVYGGHRLVGDVEISGAKNAVVAILPAVILADGVCRIENIPNIMDVATSLEILSSIGAQVRRLNKNTVEIDPRPISTHVVPHDLARHMRASYYFIGALLGGVVGVLLVAVWGAVLVLAGPALLKLCISYLFF